MKFHIGGVLLGLALAVHQLAPAQIAAQIGPQTGQEPTQDTASFLDIVETDAASLERKYNAGSLRSGPKLIKYVQALTLLGRYEAAFQVQNTALENKRLPRSAENVRLAADLLLFQNKSEPAIPFLQEAISLGDKGAQIQLAEAFVKQSQNSQDKNCPRLEAEITKAIAAGMPPGAGSMFIGHCYFERAQQKMQPKCRKSQRASAYSVMPSAARDDIVTSKAYFKTIPKDSAAAESAGHWLVLYRNPAVLRQYMCGEIEG